MVELSVPPTEKVGIPLDDSRVTPAFVALQQWAIQYVSPSRKEY